MSWFTKALSAMRHPSRPLFISGMLRRTRFDYRREVGDGLDSSVVTAPIRWVQRALPEARLMVRRRNRAGGVVEMVDHPMLVLIQKPNDYYGDLVLWAATLLSWYLDGNAYWLKVRNGVGRPAELWWVPWWMIEPRVPLDGSAFLSHYEYKPGGGFAPMRIEPEDVVHFRDGMNPHNMRKGLSSLDGVIREIFMDLESSNFVASLLRNMGVPGVVISPKGGAMPAPEDVEATKTWFQEAFGGDRRGGPLVMGAPTDVQPYGFNPQQMNMGEARDIAEERVCAVIGVPAAVVGFGAGLQTAKVGATMEELFKTAWRNGVLPVARAIADELKRSLLPDFGPSTGSGQAGQLEVLWDTDEVRALQDDEDKETERWNKRVAGGWVQVYEAREATGLDVDDSHRIYLRSIAMMEVPAGAPPRAPDAAPEPKRLTSAKAEPVLRTEEKADRAGPTAYKRGAAFALMLQRQERGLRESFEKVLAGVFGRFGKAAREAARELIEEQEPKTLRQAQGERKETKADERLIAAILDKLGIPAWSAELAQAYGAHYLTVANSVSDAAERAGLGTGLPDPVARAIVASGGRRAGLIDLEGQTREAMFDALAEGRAEGEGVEALADRIVEHVEGGHWRDAETRARVIARTETKFAQNISTVERAKAAGVERFVVFDGRLGPGRSKPDHIERDGSIVTAGEADAMAAAEHPNGTLSFAPHFRGGRMMLTKSMTIEEMDDAGTGLARIAVLSAVDSDGDTYASGAFSWKEGGHQWVQILPAHDRRAMPLGKARVYEEGDAAFAELNLNLHTQAGRDWHAALKFDLAKGNPVQEWSYGFEVVDTDYQMKGGQRVRVLKQLDVHEVSPVLKGAGVGTATLTIKSAALKDERFATVVADLAAMAEAIGGDPTVLSATGVKQLAVIHGAFGKALAAINAEQSVPDDTALAGYLRSLSRHHLDASPG